MYCIMKKQVSVNSVNVSVNVSVNSTGFDLDASSL